MIERETMEFDVVIVGAGPAGLSAAIKLATLNSELSICVIDKSAEVGAHILSGAVLDPKALNELIPEWQEKSAPIKTKVTKDKFLLLTKNNAFKLPTPPQMQNHGNYIISLSEVCRWLAEYAENLGINIFPGFAAVDIVFENNAVCGIITDDKGIDKEGKPTQNFQPGLKLLAKQTFFAEGCRGSLTECLIKKFDLRKNSDPQTYGLGIKEVWQIPEENHKKGEVIHSIGWPLDNKTYGGSFIYYMAENLLATGFVIGLDYTNPYLNPYEEFQKFKTHPKIAANFKNGKRIAYGARALNEGGYQSIPKLTFPGGLIIGCGAGFLNVPKIKGIHNAMKSGMIAAETVAKNLSNKEQVKYANHIENSWIKSELHRERNIRPAMNWGLYPGLIYAAFETYILRGKAPWTFKNHADYKQLKPAVESSQITYPKHDGTLTFDLMTSVFLTQSKHDENQPCHLRLTNQDAAIDINFNIYASPEQRYCPAGVYEIVNKDQDPKLQINYANCIQCKACDIKDPTQNIVWTPPEGGSGPGYTIT